MHGRFMQTLNAGKLKFYSKYCFSYTLLYCCFGCINTFTVQTTAFRVFSMENPRLHYTTRESQSMNIAKF